MRTRLLALLTTLALIAAACASGSDDDSGAEDPSSTTAPSDAAADGGDGADGDADTDAGSDDDDGSDDPADDGTGGEPSDGDGEPGDGSDPVTTTPDGRELVWTVVAVAFDDTLNVRVEPNFTSTMVGDLPPWSTVEVNGQVDDDPAQWRGVWLPDGTIGWVNNRFVVAQPETLTDADRAALTTLAEEFIAFATTATGSESGADLFAPRALWVAGIGIFADAGSDWNWIPVDEVDTAAEWDAEREFSVDVGADFDCGADCVLSLRDFLNVARFDDTTEILIDDIPGENRGFLDGMLFDAPESLHRIVLDTPAADPQVALDWQRFHLIPDWSTGEPRIHLVHNHGWTP